MTVIGIKSVSFTAQDGKAISGTSFYLAEPIEKDGEGVAVSKVFISAEKMIRLDFIPHVGDLVSPRYNRYGKVDSFDRGNE